MTQEVIQITEREVEVIEVIERGPAGPTGAQPDINYTVVSSAQTLQAADLIAADTSGGAFTLTLPANPSNGDAVDIFDFSETFDTNNLTIARNGSKIESLTEDLVCNVEGAYFTLIYTGATRGWQVLPRYGTSGGGGESVLTTQGDTLYRAVGVNARLPIGTAGQVLKVNSGATAPEWGTISTAPSGAAGGDLTGTYPNPTLGASGASAGTYTKVTVDTKGRVTSGTSATATDVGLGNVSNTAQVTSVTGTAPIASSGGTTPAISISAATTSAAGSMSAADKLKLDGIAAGAEVNVNADWNASSGDAQILNKPTLGGAAALNVGTTTGTVAAGDDARLSDSRTPTAHAASHAASGSDPLFDQDLNTTDLPTFAGLSVTGSFDAASFITNGALNVQNSALFIDDGATAVEFGLPFQFANGAEANSRTSLGLEIGTDVAAASHTHGNITSDGKLGSTAGLPVVTTTSGAVTTLALGTAGQILRTKSDLSGVEFADPAASGVSSVSSSASDVLGVSGSNITGVDANADRIVYWNNTSNKLAYGTPADAGAAAASHTHTSADINSQTASNGHVLTANGSGGASFAALPASGISNVDSTLADVMSVSGSNLVADDGGLVDSSNPALVWDDAAGKAVWANPLRRTAAGAFYVGVAPTTTALGTDATNIQPSRAAATQVASGQQTVNIGVESTASGSRCIALGWRASSTGTDGVVVGRSSSAGQQATALGSVNTASGLGSVAIGNTVTANAQDAVAIGSYDANDNGLIATAIRAVGLNAIANLRAMFATRPFNAVYWGGQTTNNTATILNLDATATNRFTIAANTALAVDILLVARRSDVADKWLVARRFLGIRRDGSNNTSLIGAVQTLGTDQSEGSPTWSFTLTADDTNEALQLEVTGATSETVQWRATAIYRVV